MQEQLDINKPLLKSESGLLVDPSIIESKQQELKRIGADSAIEKYNEVYNKRLNAPIPDVKIPYSYILTRAVPPKMNGYTDSGILINQLDIDVRTAKKLEVMSENVSDYQQVLLFGPHVNSGGIELEQGDMVKLNFSRYKSVREGQHAEVSVGYDIPIYTIDDNEYLLLDARDIQYVKSNK